MKTGTIQNLIGVLQHAFEKLNTAVSNRDVEMLAVTIHKSMSFETRHFHTSEHVLSLTDREAPLRSLAAVFHDLIYYQVDQCFPAMVYDLLAPYVVELENHTAIADIAPHFALLEDMRQTPPTIAFNDAPPESTCDPDRPQPLAGF